MHLESLGQLPSVMAKIKEAGNAEGLGNGVTILKKAFDGLSESQIAAKLSAAGLSDSLVKQVLSMLSAAQTTAALSAAEKEAIVFSGGLSAALKGIGNSIKTMVTANPILAAVTALLAVFTVTTAIADYYSKALDRAQEKAKESKQAYEDITAELSSLSDKLKDVQTRIEELKTLQSQKGLTLVEENELKKLELQNDELEREARIKKALAQMKGSQAAEDAEAAITKRSESYDPKEIDMGGYTTTMYTTGTRVEAAGYYIDESEKKQGELARLTAEQKQLEANWSQDEAALLADKQWKALDKQVKALRSEIDDANEKAGEYITELAGESEQLYDEYGNVINGHENTVEELNNLKQRFDQTLMGGQGAVDSLVQYFDNKENDSSVQKLTDAYSQYSAGSISRQDLISMQEFSDVMEDTGISADYLMRHLDDLARKEQAATAAANRAGFEQLFASLPLSQLEEYVALAKAGKIDESTIASHKELRFLMEQTGVSAEEAAAAVKKFSSGYRTTPELLETMQSAQELFDKAKEEADSGGISTNTLTSIAGRYSSMQSAVTEYSQGLISDADLLQSLEQSYTADSDAYRASFVDKLEHNETFFANLKKDNGDFFNELAKGYGTDADNWQTLADVKEDIDQILIDRLKGMWGDFYGSFEDNVKKDEDGLYYYVSDHPEVTTRNDREIEEQINQTNEKYLQLKEKAENSVKLTATFKPAPNLSRSTKGADPGKAFDWIETKIDRTEESIAALQEQINNASSYAVKNPLTNTAIDLMQKKLDTLLASYDTYMEKAEQVGLSKSYIDKIQSGSLEIETVKDSSVVKKIEEYQKFYDAAQKVHQQISETSLSLKEMARTRLDNIIHDFDSLTDLLETYTGYREKLLSLRQKQGTPISDSDYMELIVDQGHLYEALSQKYNQAAEEFQSLLSAGKLDEGSDEWYGYKKQIEEIRTSMLDCQEAVEGFKDSILTLRLEPFDAFISQLESIDSELADMSSLLGSDGLFLNGMITDKGLAQLGLYAQQLVNAKQKSAEYANGIRAVNELYENGSLTLDEYSERISQYESAQRQAALASKEARDAILQFSYDAIQSEIDDMNELISKKKEALQSEKELNDYKTQIADKQKHITSLQNRINALSNSSDRRDIASRLQLMQELADAQKDLENTQKEHERSTVMDGLDEEAAAYEKAKQEELEDLKTNLDKQQAVIDRYLKDVTNNYETIYDILSEYSSSFHMNMTEQLTAPWQDAAGAAKLYADSLADAIAQINLETGKIKLPGTLPEGGSDSHAWDSYSGGQWQKTDKGWWYDAGNGDFPSGKFADINRQTYAFNTDGYMLTGWQEAGGSWYYMEPENGQMVKSTWRQDKNGDWYYLTENGSMAVRSSIRAAGNEGYYLVDENGKWDGQRVMEPDFTKYPRAYKNGARRIQSSQLAWTQEDGAELITRPGDGAILTALKAGDGVLKAGWSDRLFEFAGNPSDFIANQLHTFSLSPPTYDISAARGNIEFNSPLMELHVEGGLSNDMAQYLNEQVGNLKKEIPNIVWSNAKTGLRSRGKW